MKLRDLGRFIGLLFLFSLIEIVIAVAKFWAGGAPNKPLDFNSITVMAAFCTTMIAVREERS